MKKLFLSIIGLLALAIGGVGLYYSAFLPKQRPAPDIEVELTPELIERGRYLTVNVLQCIDCHSERDWNYYGGPPVPPIGAGRSCMDKNTMAAGVNAGQETFPGRLCIRNITPDPDTGLGNWTDGEIIRAVREGVSHDGEGLFPIMPYFIYRNVSDEDMMAVVAYLRSMEPVKSVWPERTVDFPLSRLIQMWPEPLQAPVVAPDPLDRMAYGEYLAVISRCEFCHTPKDPSSMQGFEGRRFAGGMPFFLNGKTMYTMNLTPHESGLGAWTKEQFVQRFKMYAEPRQVSPQDNTMMNWNAFSGMTDEDLGMLYDFFMTLPPVPLELEPI